MCHGALKIPRATEGHGVFADLRVHSCRLASVAFQDTPASSLASFISILALCCVQFITKAPISHVHHHPKQTALMFRMRGSLYLYHPRM